MGLNTEAESQFKSSVYCNPISKLFSSHSLLLTAIWRWGSIDTSQ